MELIQSCCTLRVCACVSAHCQNPGPGFRQRPFSLAVRPDTQRRIASHHIDNIKVVGPGEREKDKLEIERGNVA